MPDHLQNEREQFYFTKRQQKEQLTIKRIFWLRSWIEESCSKTEFRAGISQDSREVWEKPLVVRNTTRNRRIFVLENYKYSGFF